MELKQLPVPLVPVVMVKEYDKTALKCTATGEPPPTMKCYKELKNSRVEVKNGSVILIETEEGRGVRPVSKNPYPCAFKMLADRPR